MTVRVAIMGAGVMGADHARILSSDVPGAQLQIMCDTDQDRARSVGEACGAVDVMIDPFAAMARSDVDAVLIASPDETHSELTLAAIKAGKPVLCEKPLAQTSDDCLKVIGAEVERGKRLVQVGFMRRFDPFYVEMKSVLGSGVIGRASMMHNFHRNLEAPAWFTGQMAISNSAPHEFDIARFVLGSELVAITSFQGRSDGEIAPVMMVLETHDGLIVTIEVNNNAGYGYDVRGELVGQKGSVDLGTPTHSTVNAALMSATGFAKDWRSRFAEAYRLQNKVWIAGIGTGIADENAASAWDGYCATAIAEAGVASLVGGSRASIGLADKPGIYEPRASAE